MQNMKYLFKIMEFIKYKIFYSADVYKLTGSLFLSK